MTSKTSAPIRGAFKVILDNAPISLEGRVFSHRQILVGLQSGVFRPGMKFRNLDSDHAEFVLTPMGLEPAHKSQPVRGRPAN